MLKTNKYEKALKEYLPDDVYATKELLDGLTIPYEILTPTERFYRTLKEATKIEKLICNKMGWEWIDANNRDKDYKFDIRGPLAGGKILTLEIKDESNHKSTGNICVEIDKGKRGKPSGVMVTKADFMVHYFSDNEIIVYLPELIRDSPENGATLEPFYKHYISTEKKSGGYVAPKSIFNALKTKEGRKPITVTSATIKEYFNKKENNKND